MFGHEDIVECDELRGCRDPVGAFNVAFDLAKADNFCALQLPIENDIAFVLYDNTAACA